MDSHNTLLHTPYSDTSIRTWNDTTITSCTTRNPNSDEHSQLASGKSSRYLHAYAVEKFQEAPQFQ